jgi:hypothetical protein
MVETIRAIAVASSLSGTGISFAEGATLARPGSSGREDQLRNRVDRVMFLPETVREI